MVDELAAAEARIQRLTADLALAEHDATHDELTRVLNRRGFFKAAAAEAQAPTIDRSRLIIVDADRFKEVNDTYGHAVGDFLLQAIATSLRDVFGLAAIIGRSGDRGDEFAVITSAGHLDKTLGLTASTISLDGAEVTVALSAGATEFGGRRDLSMVMREADLALYQAKQTGGGLAIFDPLRDRFIASAGRPSRRLRDRETVSVQAEVLS